MSRNSHKRWRPRRHVRRWWARQGDTTDLVRGPDIGEGHKSVETIQPCDSQSRVYSMSGLTADEVTEYRDRRWTRRHDEARNEELCH